MAWFKQKIEKEKMLNATDIGKYFNIGSQRLNLIFSELGWVEKDISGWNITKLGLSNGGKQLEHSISGVKYCLWNKNIIENKSLLEVFNHEKVNNIDKKEQTAQAIGFREKFEAKIRTQDGHFVRSKAEAIIDNLLYQYGLVHAYERKLPLEEDIYCDFYIPSGNTRPQAVYIEYWGLENDVKYKERKNKKLEIYKKEGLNLIELNEDDIQNLDDILPRKLLQYKIKVY